MKRKAVIGSPHRLEEMTAGLRREKALRAFEHHRANRTVSEIKVLLCMISRDEVRVLIEEGRALCAS